MNIQKNEICIDSIKNSLIQDKGITFDQAISEKVSEEASTVILNDPKYEGYIENPCNAGFFTEEILKEKKGDNRIVNIDSELSHEEITSLARASIQNEKELLESITSKEMKNHIFTKLLNSKYKFYQNFLWRTH